MSPLTALLMTLAFVVGIIALFWPERGLYWRWFRVWRRSERVLVEDALKHLYDCEVHGRGASLESLCGAIDIGRGRGATLLTRLGELELIEPDDQGLFRLSAEGRRDALRIVRIHRLWERYLADCTGTRAEHWHRRADRYEHGVSDEEADRLAASLGFPRYDPHGDPIPTRGGDVTVPGGEPLSTLPAGTLGVIVHVEDEPEELYAQIVAAELHVGMQLRVVESGPVRVRLEVGGEELVLAPVVAGNVTVRRLPEPTGAEEPAARLASLEPGEEGTVVGFSAACRGAQLRRLLDLGLVPGTIVRAELRSPAGDPTSYWIRGAQIALRREQAELIHIGAKGANGTSLPGEDKEEG